MNTAKLRGFNYPLTPKGKSTLNPPPPWYYSSDFLDIEFWAQPAAVAALLPPGFDPDPAANGHCNALFYDWQFSGANEEYLDPARYQYREFFILVDALFEGKSVCVLPLHFRRQRCCACAWLDSRLSEASRPSVSDEVLRRNRKSRSGSRARIEVRWQPNRGRAPHR